MNRNKIIILGITAVFLLVITTIGFAYGYYVSFVKKIDQSKRITVSSGSSQITYIASLTEEETVESIKPGFSNVDYFAVKNTGQTNAMYFIYLENVINDFVYKEDITYSIYRTKGSNNMNFDFIDIDALDYTDWEVIISDEVYPTQDTLLKETKETIEISNDYYIYAMVINYKYRLDKDQTIDSEHVFGGHVKLIPTDTVNTENIYNKGTLAHEILNNSIINLNGTKYNTSTSINLVTDKKTTFLALTEDEYGSSYYYRGNVIDNYINFNNMCWKIIRIAGDGSIKLSLYDNTSTCNETLKNNHSPLIKNEDVIIEKLNEEIRNELNNWYEINNFKLVENTIKSNNWCITNEENKYNIKDNTLIENFDIYIVQNQDELGNYSYNYYTKKGINEENITLKCDEFNKKYESLIGLLTVEEIIYMNSDDYNIHNYNIATSSLSKYESIDDLNYVYTYNLNEVPVNTPLAINPIIILKPNVNYLRGNGTLQNPYEIN